MTTRDNIYRWLEQAGAKAIRDSGDGNLVATCPFHRNKTGTSFAIRVDNGLFICYSAGCGVTGNLVNFLMSGLGWKFQKARDAADAANIPTLDDPSAYSLPEYSRRNFEEAEVECLMTEGHLGLYDFCPGYLLRRGFKSGVLRRWGIGYDYGARRVTIPVRGGNGKLVGISKRATEDYQQPKYLHLGFKKGRYLYGMDRVPKGAAVVVTEGQLDAVAWYQLSGDSSAYPVSTMGALVTNKQIDWLARHCGVVVLAFDNDSDGRMATLRVGDALLPRKRAAELKTVTFWPKNAKDVGDLLKRPSGACGAVFSSAVYYGEARLVLRGLVS